MKCLALLSCVVMTNAAIAQQYTVVNLGVLNSGDGGSRATAVSNLGVVTGWSGGQYQSFTWTQHGGMAPLPKWTTYPYAFSQAINSSGLIGGYVQNGFNGAYKPALWSNGTVNVIPQLAGTTGGKIFSISENGYMAGFENGNSGNDTAFRYDGSTIISLGVLPSGETLNDAYAVSNAGQVVGQADTVSSYKAFIWDSAHGGQDLGWLPGDNGAIAWAINNNGMVIGESLLNQGATSRGFWWTQAAGMHEIPGLNGSTDFQLRG